jgi:hypothetical protein
MAQQFRNPDGIFDIRLAAGNGLDMLRVDDEQFALAFQDIIDRSPVGSAAGEVPTIGPFPSAFPQ